MNFRRQILAAILTGAVVSTSAGLVRRDFSASAQGQQGGPVGPTQAGGNGIGNASKDFGANANAGAAGLSIRATAAPAEAFLLAWQDAQTLNFLDRLFARWIWMRKGKLENWKATAFGIQFDSRASALIRPIPIAGGKLLRIDLRWYWPRDEDLKDVIVLWERFANDPAFSKLFTKDGIDLLNIPLEQLPRVFRKTVRKQKQMVRIRKTVEGQSQEVDEEREVDGVVNEWVPFGKDADVNVVRQNPASLEPYQSFLQFATLSQAPVVEYRYFVSRGLTTIRRNLDEKVDGLFADVYGGEYYNLRGIKKSKEKGVTDRDKFFEDFLGIGNAKAGLKSAQVFDRLRSDSRAALAHSDVTGKPRRVDIFPTLAERGGQGKGYITSDPKDGDVDLTFDATQNLLDGFRAKAQEGIFPDGKGTPLCPLFNFENGELQD